MGCIPLTTLSNHRDRSNTTTREVTPKDEITSQCITKIYCTLEYVLETTTFYTY